ncbi:MAG: hypothetical protein V4718_04265 [Pseudomonadota bacterium]
MNGGTQLKYVRHSTVGFIVWPARYPGLTHKEVSTSILRSKDAPFGNVISAGFVDWDFDGMPICGGRSESLNVDSRKDDTAALMAEWGMKAPAAAPSTEAFPVLDESPLEVGDHQ